MLIINEELLAIDDAIDDLVKAVLSSEVMQDYREKRRCFEENQELQAELKDFYRQKEDYEEVKQYAAFRPEIKEKRRQLYAWKRQLDLKPEVKALRQAEVALQEVLAMISEELSEVVSEDIFVDTGLPLAPHKRPHGKDKIREGNQDV